MKKSPPIDNAGHFVQSDTATLPAVFESAIAAVSNYKMENAVSPTQDKATQINWVTSLTVGGVITATTGGFSTAVLISAGMSGSVGTAEYLSLSPEQVTLEYYYNEDEIK